MFIDVQLCSVNTPKYHVLEADFANKGIKRNFLVYMCHRYYKLSKHSVCSTFLLQLTNSFWSGYRGSPPYMTKKLHGHYWSSSYERVWRCLHFCSHLPSIKDVLQHRFFFCWVLQASRKMKQCLDYKIALGEKKEEHQTLTYLQMTGKVFLLILQTGPNKSDKIREHKN